MMMMMMMMTTTTTMMMMVVVVVVVEIVIVVVEVVAVVVADDLRPTTERRRRKTGWTSKGEGRRGRGLTRRLPLPPAVMLGCLSLRSVADGGGDGGNICPCYQK